MSSDNAIPVYLETGKRRTFAGALDWPGWCRSGRDETAAMETLLNYSPRYARVLLAQGIAFPTPVVCCDLALVESLPGSATTDFGAPAAVPAADERSMDDEALEFLSSILKTCWLAFDRAFRSAEGKILRKGPRGGGRDVPAIVQHVLDANRAYLAKLAWKPTIDPEASPAAQLDQMLEDVLNALTTAAAGELPSRRPRGGKLWPPRYLARRAAWHMLDHAWEIEDRIVQPPYQAP
jgi:hypothetical protein